MSLEAQSALPDLDGLDLELAGLDRPRIDLAGAERAARELLVALGEDVESERLRDTPRRVAEGFAELLTPAPFRATSFTNEERGVPGARRLAPMRGAIP